MKKIIVIIIIIIMIILHDEEGLKVINTNKNRSRSIQTEAVEMPPFGRNVQKVLHDGLVK